MQVGGIVRGPQPRIDVTVVKDSSDALVAARSALLQVDLIATVVDVSAASDPSGVKTKITLSEITDGPSGGQRGARTLMVMETYQAVCMLIKHAENNERT